MGRPCGKLYSMEPGTIDWHLCFEVEDFRNIQRSPYRKKVFLLGQLRLEWIIRNRPGSKTRMAMTSNWWNIHRRVFRNVNHKSKDVSWKTLPLLPLLLIVSVKSYSQTSDVIVSDRPGQTNPPTVVPGWYFSTWDRVLNGSQARPVDILTTNFLYNTSLIRIGLIENCELRLTLNTQERGSIRVAQSSTVKGFNPISGWIKARSLSWEENDTTDFLQYFSDNAIFSVNRNSGRHILHRRSSSFMQNTLSDRYSLGYKSWTSMGWKSTECDSSVQHFFIDNCAGKCKYIWRMLWILDGEVGNWLSQWFWLCVFDKYNLQLDIIRRHRPERDYPWFIHRMWPCHGE